MNHVLTSRAWAGLGVGLLLVGTAFLVAAPKVQAGNDSSLGLVLQDTNSNGQLNRIVLSIDNDAAEAWLVDGTPAFTVTQGGEPVAVNSVTISGSASADPVVVNINLNEATTMVNTDGVNANAVEVTYTQAGGGANCVNCLRDGNGELSAIVAGDSSAANIEIDAMAPRIVAQVPASGALEVYRDASITMVFSEPMNIETDDIRLSPDVESLYFWTSSDTTLTINPESLLSTGLNTVSIEATDMALVPNAFGGAINGSSDASFNFSVSSNTGQTTSGPHSVTITVPNIVEEWQAGATMSIAWELEGAADMPYADLYYSIDGGTSYTVIARNVANDGLYSWLVPSSDTDFAYIKVEGTNLQTVLASDVSSQFQIVVDGQDEEPGDGTDQEFGPSPVTGGIEAIAHVEVGDYIMSPYFSTVYYVDVGLVRRPFMDSQTYFTYEDSFAAVRVVTDATLPTLPLGSPMLPRAGVVLVKIMSDNRVYATAFDSLGRTELRWVTSEQLAIDIYGSNWADYVIDVPVTLFGKYTAGANITSDMLVDLGQMKTRAEVNQ